MYFKKEHITKKTNNVDYVNNNFLFLNYAFIGFQTEIIYNVLHIYKKSKKKNLITE